MAFIALIVISGLTSTTPLINIKNQWAIPIITFMKKVLYIKVHLIIIGGLFTYLNTKSVKEILKVKR